MQIENEDGDRELWEEIQDEILAYVGTTHGDEAKQAFVEAITEYVMASIPGLDADRATTRVECGEHSITSSIAFRESDLKRVTPVRHLDPVQYIVMRDQMDFLAAPLAAYCKTYGNGDGFELGFEGAGLKEMPDGFGGVAIFEYFDSQPRLVVWADINQVDPTHVIDLSGASEKYRWSEEEEEENLKSGSSYPDNQHAFESPYSDESSEGTDL